MGSLQKLKRIADGLPPSEKMPVFFLGHGSPMNAIGDNEFVAGFRKAGEQVLTRPKAILCISAHWFTRGTWITAMPSPRTIHDFYGFPKALFDVQYPAPGEPLLAREIQSMLSQYHAGLDEDWGLDHGAWSVIRHMYPDAEVPVIQLSIDHTKPAEYHYRLAGELRSLRDRGVLIIGSGNIVHNLRLVDWKNSGKNDHGFDWAREAQLAINDRLMEGNYEDLLRYDKQGIAWKTAIPTPDHYLPLIYTLGLKESREKVNLFNDKLVMGSISMTSLRIS